MACDQDNCAAQSCRCDDGGEADIFSSDVVNRVRTADNRCPLPGGTLLLPDVFGFCRGVKRALRMLADAVESHRDHGTRLILLGEIIHNPWVNEYFSGRGVRLLAPDERVDLERHIGPRDCAIVPAFGVPPDIQQRLAAIGCRVVDTSCGDVRRLWRWAERAARDGYGVVIYGRPQHDETVVTKTRLAAVGGRYVVAANLDQIAALCAMLSGDRSAEDFRTVFGPEATNADSIEPFTHLAQVSQTTMLYDDTMKVRELMRTALSRRFNNEQLSEHLQVEPTVCRATQQRQTAAVELCRNGLDLAIVVGGFGSSNTRHLYELARDATDAWFIEDARGLLSDTELATIDIDTDRRTVAHGWLPTRRPLRIGVLAGASSPEVVVGEVLQRLAGFLGGEQQGTGERN